MNNNIVCYESHEQTALRNFEPSIRFENFPVLLVLLITLTSGLLMCKFIFEIWKSLILMTQMPSHFYTLPASYLICTSGATYAAESKSDLQVMGLSTLDLQFV
jgi:hypothetical protein